jgi:fumarylpyruvate hydrolase
MDTPKVEEKSFCHAMAEEYVIAPLPPPTLPVAGSATARFPVARVFCIGRNYAAHAREMGHDPEREAPFFFMKPATAVYGPADGVAAGAAPPMEFPYPPQTGDVHHELEMVVALGRGGRDIAVDAALEHVWGYGVGLDMTRRDLQAEAKKAARPWEIGKAFDRSAPCSALRRAADGGHPAAGAAVTLAVNGAERQRATLGHLIWSVAEQVAHLSRYFELLPGDVIMTGTPAGVGAVVRGDVMVGEVEGVGKLHVVVV